MTSSDRTSEPWTPRSSGHGVSYNPLRISSNIWTGASARAAADAEESILSKYISSPYRLGRVAIEMSHLGLGTQQINTLEVNADATDGVPLVLTHGAGSGIGFFYRNFEALARLGGVRRRLLVFDWLGCAGSSRPAYPYGLTANKPGWMLSEEERVDAAIRFSVDSLEAWRQAMGIEQMDLAAHSMGGYLSTQYALAHPHRVRRLLLISPVGWADKPSGELGKEGKASGLFGALWESGLGNFGFAKVLGRMASGLAQHVVTNRMHIDDEEEKTLIGQYFWHSLCSRPISAEKNVNWLLTPYVPPAPFGFYARRPVVTEPAERLAKLPPTTLLYGSHDLHYIPTMPQAIKAVEASMQNPIRMAFIPHADHHLYVDNPEAFHKEAARAFA